MPGSISFANGNQLVQITPQTELPVSTLLTLTISGVLDVAGNAVPAKTTHFTTAPGPTASTTSIINTNPPSNATNVPVNVAISLQANGPVDPTTVNSSTLLIQDNTLNQYVAGTYSQSADDTTVYFIPGITFATGRGFTVYFYGYGMTDLLGNPISVCCGISNFSFTTGVGPSLTPPTVTAISPANSLTGVPVNAQIMIQFSEPINSETLGQVVLSTGGNNVSVTSSLTNGNQTLILTPTTLVQNTAYSLTMSGVTDLAGNAMSSVVTSVFVAGPGPDFSNPSVVSLSPANQATGVSTATTVQVRFSKLMNRLTVTPSTFTVTGSGNSAIAGTISTSSDGTTAVFTPASPLAASTAYTVQLTGGITDLSGQALPVFQSVFTTGTQ